MALSLTAEALVPGAAAYLSVMDNPPPVSYTHLDVYKRQGIHNFENYQLFY